MNVVDMLPMVAKAVQWAALVAVMLICVCRLNATSAQTALRVKATYILLGAGAFAMLLGSSYGWESCFFSVGVALCLGTDRRRSVCYT